MNLPIIFAFVLLLGVNTQKSTTDTPPVAPDPFIPPPPTVPSPTPSQQHLPNPPVPNEPGTFGQNSKLNIEVVSPQQHQHSQTTPENVKPTSDSSSTVQVPATQKNPPAQIPTTPADKQTTVPGGESQFDDPNAFDEEAYDDRGREEQSSFEKEEEKQKEKPKIPQEVPQKKQPVIAKKPQESLEIYQVGEKITAFVEKVNEGMLFYQMNVGKSLKKYLFLTVQPASEDEWQKMTLFIYRKSTNELLKVCAVKFEDSCYLPLSTFAPEQLIYVTVTCEQNCHYELLSHWSDIEHLKPGDNSIFKFGQIVEQIYHVELRDEGVFDQIRITVKPRASKDIIENLKIYGKYGRDSVPGPQNFDFKSLNLWEDGEGVFLTRKEMPQPQFILLITGQKETTYNIKIEKVMEGQHQLTIGSSVYDYIKKGGSKVYHMALTDTNLPDQYAVRFSTMIGKSQVLFYTDAARTKSLLTSTQYEYMQDSEIIIQKKDYPSLKNGLFIYVECPEKDSTFMLHTLSRKSNQAVQLHQHIYSFIKLTKSRLIAFDFLQWAGDDAIRVDTDEVKFNVFIVNVNGAVQPEFRICKQAYDLCTKPQSFQASSTAILPTSTSMMGMRRSYQFVIPQMTMHLINEKFQKQGVVVVNLKCVPKAGTKECLSALEYMNSNKVIYLREKRPIQDRVESGDSRLYKFNNEQKDLNQIVLNVNTISGSIKITGYMTEKDGVTTEVFPSQGNKLIFKSNKIEIIALGISAEEMAVYSLSMNLVRKFAETATTIAMSEDVSYTVVIPPEKTMFFEMVPIYNELMFEYSSSSSIRACLIDESLNKCKLDGQTLKITTEGILKLKQNSIKRHRVQLFNPLKSTTAQVTSIFHSAYFDHCEQRKMGKAYVEMVSDKMCFTYKFSTLEPIEIYLSKRSYIYLGVVLLVCGVSESMPASRHILETVLLEKNCQNKPREITLIWAVRIPIEPSTTEPAAQPTRIKLHVVVQHAKGILTLPEGISYGVKKMAGEGPIKLFSYDVFNHMETRMVVNELKGHVQLYAKVVSASEKMSTDFGMANYDYTDQNDHLFSFQPLLVIPKEAFAKCIDCCILLAVYAKNQVGEEIDFELQFIQDVETLDERHAAVKYLEANSVAYYSYTNSEPGANIVILISDHNQNCASIFLDKSEFPSSKSYSSKSEDGELTLSKAEATRYYITVVASKACSYSLSVQASNEPINELIRGRQVTIRMEQDDVKYFVLAQMQTVGFKILSMAKYGEIQIYSKKSPVIGGQPTNKLELDYTKFDHKSQIKNVLILTPKSPSYCSKCHILVAIKALKKTQAILYFTYPNTVVPLVEKKVLYDMIYNAGDETLAVYDRIQDTNFEVVVYKGELEVEVSFKSKKFQQTFLSKSDVQQMKVFMNKESAGSTDGSKTPPFEITLRAKSNQTRYSLELVSFAGEGINTNIARYSTLRTGEPNWVFVRSQRAQCLTGYIRSQDEELVLSTSQIFTKYLESLITLVKIDGVQFNPKITIVRNLAIVDLDLQAAHAGKKLQMCFKINSTKLSEIATSHAQAAEDENKMFVLIVTQSDRISSLAPDSLHPVEKEGTFVVHSDREFLLDVFECKGKAMVTVASTSKELKSATSQRVSDSSFPKQTHALKVLRNDTTFFKVEGELALIRWIPIDYQTQTGLGYTIFTTGNLAYTNGFKYLNVEVGGLEYAKPSKSKIQQVIYTLYVSPKIEQIQANLKCGLFPDNNHLKIQIGRTPQNYATGDQITFQLSKQLLIAKFGDSPNLFISVVADAIIALTTMTPEGKEHYRFMYDHQQIPIEAYTMSGLETLRYELIIAVFVTGGLFLVLATYLFSRKIVPLISRLRAGGLVQENDVEQKKNQSVEVPQSSDRNRQEPGSLAEGQVSDRLP